MEGVMSEGLPPAELRSATGGARRVVASKKVLRAAAMHFLQQSGLDMDLLAAELNISRATLYRVAGSRDELLAETFWAIDRKLFADAAVETSPRDVESVIEIQQCAPAPRQERRG
jgi:AcrR family transcriptional regulator